MIKMNLNSHSTQPRANVQASQWKMCCGSLAFLCSERLVLFKLIPILQRQTQTATSCTVVRGGP